MAEWTHCICTTCWVNQNPGREPVRVRDDDAKPCCFCGQKTDAGIYTRCSPEELWCHGDHSDWEQINSSHETRDS